MAAQFMTREEYDRLIAGMRASGTLAPQHLANIEWEEEAARRRAAYDKRRNRIANVIGLASGAGIGAALAGVGAVGAAGGGSGGIAGSGVLAGGQNAALGLTGLEGAAGLASGAGVLAPGGGVLSSLASGGIGSTIARSAIPIGVSSMAGKSGGGNSNAAADLQAQIAQQLFQQTDPLRQSLIGRSQAFLDGGMDVGASPVYGAFKDQAERQFQNARSNVIADTPTGGPLTAALTNLNSGRASTLAQGAGSIADTEVARALALATGQTGQAVSGLGQAASLQAMVAQSEADREAGMLGALGAGAGAYFGSKA